MLTEMRRMILIFAAMITGCPQPVETVPDPLPEPRAAAPGPPGEAPPPASARPRVRGGAGTWSAEAPSDASPTRDGALCGDCDVVLVTMCSVRQDHVDVYEDRGITPALKELAQGGYHFDTAYAASNFTLASLTAILTGRFGSATGVVGWDKGLVSDVPTLPEVLGLYGYATGGFTINAASGFRPEYGLDKGFQHLEIIEAPSDNPDGRLETGPTGSGLSAQPLVEWIESQSADQRLFAMFHTRTAHFPFVVEPPPAGQDPTGIWAALWGDDLNPQAATGQRPGVSGGTQVQGVGVDMGPNALRDTLRRSGPEGLRVWRSHYAESMGRLDQDIRAVIDVLKRTGRWEKTILIAVADHGESLGEHNEFLHGDSYFDGVVRVPLLMRIPGLPGRAEGVSPLVSHVDLLPTVLELVGAVAPAGIDGRSMLPVMSDDEAEIRRTALVEGGVSWTPRDAMRGAVISPPWALLRQPLMCTAGRPEPPPAAGEPFKCLFNLDNDPKQLTNVARQNTEVVERLQARWDGYRATKAGKATPVSVEHDPEFKALLRRSGYFNASEPSQ